MKTRNRISKRHVGLPIKFAAFDGRTYWGTLLAFRNGVASAVYQLTNDHGCVVRDCTTYLHGENLNRLTLA